MLVTSSRVADENIQALGDVHTELSAQGGLDSTAPAHALQKKNRKRKSASKAELANGGVDDGAGVSMLDALAYASEPVYCTCR